MVRLEGTKEFTFSTFADISIPLWYDWKDGVVGGWYNSEEFQFHYGTIGRWLFHLHLHVRTLFQFHYGTIGSYSLKVITKALNDFNSTMVRLEVWLCVGSMSLMLYFNSTMV